MDRYKEFMWNKDSHLSYGLGQEPTSTIQQHDRQQVEWLTLDNSHHVCLLRLSGLRVADI